MALTNIQQLTGVSNIVLVTAQSSESNLLGYQAQNGPVITSTAPVYTPSFVFHYEGEQIVTFESDITDHYVETNSAVQDQVAQKPIEVSTHGFIGDLNDVVPPSLQAQQATVMTILGNIQSYNPSLVVSALNAYNEAFQTYQIAAQLAAVVPSASAFLQTVPSASVAGSSTSGKPASWLGQTAQQAAFNYFWQQYVQRTFFTVQTPWALFRNMQIKTLRAVQSEDTRTVTDFQLTLKQMQFAQAITNGVSTTALNSAANNQNMSPRASGQGATATQLGTNYPGPTNVNAQSLYTA